ncbi:MAG: hypothetical protein L0287_35205, partial [Anaerolineae bacterium]|nr:hypothetical protein [Anaerolineae bacterium]
MGTFSSQLPEAVQSALFWLGVALLAWGILAAIWHSLDGRLTWQSSLFGPLVDRIPYVEIKQLANVKGWNLDDPSSLGRNRAYDLEIAMRQAASDGNLLVWGRKYEEPIGSNPLLLIHKEHFADFEFRHGRLHGHNIDTCVGKDSLSDPKKTYCD